MILLLFICLSKIPNPFTGTVSYLFIFQNCRSSCRWSHTYIKSWQGHPSYERSLSFFLSSCLSFSLLRPLNSISLCLNLYLFPTLFSGDLREHTEIQGSFACASLYVAIAILEYAINPCNLVSNMPAYDSLQFSLMLVSVQHILQDVNCKAQTHKLTQAFRETFSLGKELAKSIVAWCI